MLSKNIGMFLLLYYCNLKRLLFLFDFVVLILCKYYSNTFILVYSTSGGILSIVTLENG